MKAHLDPSYKVSTRDVALIDAAIAIRRAMETKPTTEGPSIGDLEKFANPIVDYIVGIMNQAFENAIGGMLPELKSGGVPEVGPTSSVEELITKRNRLVAKLGGNEGPLR